MMGQQPKQGSPKVTVPDKFGGIQQISLDVNRPLVQTESLFRFANLVAIPSRGVYSDFLMWPLVTATVTRAIYHLIGLGLISPFAGLAALFFMMLPIFVIIMYAGLQLDKTHGLFCFYRLFLLGLGFALAML